MEANLERMSWLVMIITRFVIAGMASGIGGPNDRSR
jgi:hypothetical protein